jgi:hypothetical protein
MRSGRRAAGVTERGLASGLAVIAALAAGPPADLAAQDLGRRILEADGDVAMRYATRPGVEVCERGNVRMDGGRSDVGGSWTSRWEDSCVAGGVELLVTVADGRVRGIEIGPPGTSRSDRDLGDVSPAEAADWLLSLAGRADERAAKDALLPAVIAAGVETWPRLLDIASDRSMARGIRESALFWTSRAATEVVTRELAGVAADERDDEEVRKAAVFALSRRPADESVPALMDIARTGPGRGVREAALFWLARAEDPRVIPFFEEILRASTPRR